MTQDRSWTAPPRESLLELLRDASPVDLEVVKRILELERVVQGITKDRQDVIGWRLREGLPPDPVTPEGILVGWQLQREASTNLSPFDDKLLNPASVDLRLGSTVLERQARPGTYAVADPPTTTQVVAEDGYFTLMPGHLYLASTYEHVCLDQDLVGVVDGKSSLGREGVCVHVTAGYIDPGFRGNITLEIVCALPTRLRRYMRIAQLRLYRVPMWAPAYAGHYQGDQGPRASRISEALEADMPNIWRIEEKESLK